MKKLIAAVLTLMLCLSCTAAFADKVPYIGIIQQMEHVALDQAREGFIQALKDNGYEDGVNIKINYQNGQGDAANLATIAGVYPVDGGHILLDGHDVTHLPEHKRAKFLGRVFQDPMMGTAADMNIEENLALSFRRGKHHTLRWGVTAAERVKYKDLLALLDLGLESRMTSKVGLLSGGQRQALTLLMVILQSPKVLLLDEHTAALDPKTAAKVLELTEILVAEHQLTTLMVTHNMNDAIRLGNRLIMMNEGKIAVDIRGEEKKSLHRADLIALFEKSSGSKLESDRLLLS